MAAESSNFIRSRMEADRAAGRWGGRITTRFPPEPNGYLHIGHVKAICVSFGLARDLGGTTNLRYDDTNPTTEDTEYVDAILGDVRWLGFEPAKVLYASDYFEQLYAWAVHLVKAGKAYVDDQDLEQIRAGRGTITEPGTASPWRERPVGENLDLLARMRAGEFPDGARVLRAKIDMAHPNMLMRDPLLYRIRHAHHHRTGDAWCIYPLYDWAHGQSDAIEGITHSLCSLEFEVHRELYDWFTANLLIAEPPQQIEFARLNLTYTVMSKRFLLRLVREGRVSGWDDPRMPTIAGLRRRGVPAEALVAFAERVGVARANSTVDVEVLEGTIRDVLNARAPRRMAVVRPLEVVIEDWPEGEVVWVDAPDFPPDVGLPGTRKVPLTGRIHIEATDFEADPPPGFHRLVPGGEVRLRYGHVIRCTAVERDAEGRVVRLRATHDPATLGHAPEGRKVKGVIHWVSADHALPVRLQLVDRLFAAPEPGARTGDYLDDLAPDALVVTEGYIEPAVATDVPGVRYQLERTGYFYRAPEDAAEGLVLTRIVGLKEGFGAVTEVAAPAAPAEVDPRASAEAQARIKAEARAAWFAERPEARAAHADLLAAGASEDEAWTVASDDALRTLHAAASAVAAPASVARWIANGLRAELGERAWPATRLTAEGFGRMVALVDAGTLTARTGREVLAVLVAEGGDPKAVAEARGLLAVSDAGAVEAAVDAVIAAHPGEVARYRGGEAKLLGFFIGQAMKALGGKGEPAVVKTIVAGRLSR